MSKNEKQAILLIKFEQYLRDAISDFAEEEKVYLDVVHLAMATAKIMRDSCLETDNSPFESNYGLQKCSQIMDYILKEYKGS